MKVMSTSVKTIADIAKLAGVSKATVSRALNESPLISQETKTRIHAIARAHHFAAHQGARSLSLKRSETIALIIPMAPYVGHSIIEPFFVELLRGVMFAIGERGYDLLIGQPRKNDPSDIQRYIGSKRADGLIIIGCQAYIKAIAELVGQKVPIIVWGVAENQKYCSVNCDNAAGGRLAVKHLLQLGRTRIAFLGGTQGEPEVLLRYQGYTEMLREAGHTLVRSLVTYGDYTSQSGYERMQKLLTQAPDLDAVFVCSDLMALGAMEALRESGRHVPEEISVVGFDDIPLAAYCSPPLTTIRQHISKAGEVLVHNLLQYVRDKIITTTILPVELVVRKSSDPSC
jgi:DNA-binding LacI/PurR family transcriptional regulator